MATSQNGWPVDPTTARVTINTDYADVRKGPVRRLFRAFAVAYDETVESVETISGYRDAAANASTGTPVDDSNHRSATAVDVNGFRYPYEYTHRTGWKNAMPLLRQRKVRKLLKQFPEVVWGADFTSPYRDPMHYELARGLDTAAVEGALGRIGLGTYRIVKGTGRSKKRTALYRVRSTGKKHVTRRKKIGKTVKVVAVAGRWAMTAKGDWIKLSKIKKVK